MKVAKFGGSSLADAAHIKQVCDIILSDKERRLVVVSAPGKRYPSDIKVTDMLINLANRKLEGSDTSSELKAVVERYKSIAVELNMPLDIIDVIENDLIQRLNSKFDNDKFMDLMKAAGEDNSAKIVAAYLKSINVNAKYINPREAGLLLSEEYGNARALPESYDKLNELNKVDGIMIFPGFFGYSPSGEVVTFSRGGSDITGAILAAAVKASVYENFTDVDSVFAANPNIIENPEPIPIFTYSEMRELSYGGFSVLHEEALEPVYRMGIPVNIRNTNNPDAPGTFISPERADDEERPVVGIAADKGFFAVNISKYMMNREIGFGRRLLEIFENEGVSYEHTPSGIDSICVIIRTRNCSSDKLQRIIKQIRSKLNPDEIYVHDDIAIVMIVGQGMLHKRGILAKAADALADENINVSMVNQGSSEVSIMFGVEGCDAINSVKALYKEFFN